MNELIDIARPRRVDFAGSAGNSLVGDLWGSENGRPVLLAHGGGQTRHAWGGAAERLAARGWAAVTIDQRGHGDSAWVEDAAYDFGDYADDMLVLADALAARFGARPAVIGASLGGFAAMLAEGESDREVFSALVLVDITPTVEISGVEKVLGFMAAHIEHGFATLDEAADAIAAYLPHRERPRDLGGLAKNLRRGADGRYRWHWDPRFLEGRYPVPLHHESGMQRNIDAARAIAVPTLLVRGARSELVSEEHARAFLQYVPHADYADVSGAGHMVAGDRNDAFGDAVLAFLERL